MKPYYEQDGITIYHGDCREVVPGLADVSAIVTDPPYALTANKKGGTGAASISDTPAGRSRISTGNGAGGFMGKAWDAALPSIDTWQAVLRVAKPGAHLVAFGGTRTHHRLICAIEDAGWEIRDCLMWLYGSGFPKSHDVSKAIDKAAGAKRERIHARSGVVKNVYAQYAWSRENKGTVLAPEPITEAARGWLGWGTALKPGWEPIVLARKPLDGTVAANVREYGTGALNVDGCRLALPPDDPNHRPTPSPSNRGANSMFGSGGHDGDTLNAAGRWPANVVLDEDAAAQLDAQSGELASGARSGPGGVRPCGATSILVGTGERRGSYPASVGGASRFFYTAKASKADRFSEATNDHPTVKPLDLMRWLLTLVTPPRGVVLDPFAGSGSTLKAAKQLGVRAIGIEIEERYCEIAARRLDQGVLDLESA